jgi:hypothetical protein
MLNILTSTEISAIASETAFVLVQHDFCNDSYASDIAYLMPNLATAEEYVVLVNRLLAQEQEGSLDGDAGELICASQKHYSLTQYPELFRSTPVEYNYLALSDRLYKALSKIEGHLDILSAKSN